MAKNLSNWQKFGRFLTPVVALCFFLPFFGISCDGTEIVTISGADMVGGCKPGGLAADMDDAKDDGMGGGGGMRHGGGHVESKVKNVKRSPLAIAALAIAIIASGLAWVRTRRALIASCALSFAGIAALVALYITTTGELKDITKKGLDPLGGSSKHEDSGGFRLKPDHEPKIDAGSRFGLWVTVLGFVGVATMTTLAVRDKEQPAAPPAPAPAPGAPPPV